MGSKAELGRAIEAFRTEIGTLEGGDARTKAQLQELTNLMEDRLHDGERVDDPSTADTMKELVEIYETRYPRITALANDLMTRLSGMGI